MLDQSVPLKKDKKQTKTPPNPRVLLLVCCCSVIFQVTLLWTLAFGLKLTVGVGSIGGGGGWVGGSVFFPVAGLSASLEEGQDDSFSHCNLVRDPSWGRENDYED